jgi:L-amino acid N-acyltransferase YncA
MNSLAALEILDAEPHHMDAVRSIYGRYVLHALCTFEEEVPTATQMLSRRADVLRLGLPYLVAVVDGEVAGYAYAGAYRARPAYRRTVENSVYIAQGMQGRGIGRALLAALIERCSRAGLSQMVAVVGDSANTGSIRLHESLGFEHVGVLRDVGFKFGRWVDTVLMQRPLCDVESS